MMTTEVLAAATAWVAEYADTPEAFLAILVHSVVFGADVLRDWVDTNQFTLKDEELVNDAGQIALKNEMIAGLVDQQIRDHLTKAVEKARSVGVKKAEQGAVFILHQYGLGKPSSILFEPVQTTNFFETTPNHY